MYLYVKALHIIFIVTWFAGLFYIVRLFVYQAESAQKPEPERSILQKQFAIMASRLWYGITWPSAILSLLLGGGMLWLFGSVPTWLWVKLGFVAGLYAYHFSLQHIFKQHAAGTYPFTSQQLRIWNEVATLFLVSIVLLVVVKQELSALWGLIGLFLLIVVLMTAIKIYRNYRKRVQ
ncbi:MAG TPA: CopD family protein [Chitinophagales bacterium]|nr:CopD family protein [Chitinophagales bacterium]HRK25847.1 CopD family protein [Chitinophagales bacterium]